MGVAIAGLAPATGVAVPERGAAPAVADATCNVARPVASGAPAGRAQPTSATVNEARINRRVFIPTHP